MGLRLHNTRTRASEPFVPLDPAGRRVLLYSCGPTVYSYAHIGNFRSFLLADLLRRVLERRGYQVRHVLNITDVGHMTEDHLADATGEDKLARAARELGWDPFEVARHFESAFAADARSLRLKNYSQPDADDASLHPRATEFIPEMLAMIQALLDKDFAYVDELGQVYFEIAKFPEYGQLSGKRLDELEAGARVELREGKRDPRDFALWKVDKKHLMQWDPHTGAGFRGDAFARLQRLLPGGVDARVQTGFPGWHIECSAMSRACLAELIDIHTGGEDNIFPHHECEIAQSCAALDLSMPTTDGTGASRNFARYWVHARHLLVDGRKMSKRDGTFYTARNLLDPEASGRADLVEPLSRLGFPEGRVPPAVLRLALMSCSFSLPTNFSFDSLAQARATVQRLQGRYERLREVASQADGGGSDVDATVEQAAARLALDFDDALDDNLDTASAMAAVHAFVSELNQLELTPRAARRALRAIEDLDEVLVVLDRRVQSGVVSRSELEQWRDGAFLAQRAAQLAAWRDHPERAPLLAALQAGRLPEPAGADAVTELDGDIVILLLALRHAAKADKQYPRADALRLKLQAARATIEDVADGVRWKLG
jgi:cysteinyl-tRNA synthetase